MLLRLIAAVVAAACAMPVTADDHCARVPAIKSVVDEATRAVLCINRWQEEHDDIRNNPHAGGIGTTNSVVALAMSVAVAAAQYAHENSTDSFCRDAFTQEVANLRPTYEQAVANAFKISGSMDVKTMNEVAAQCRIDSRLLGEVAQYGVRPSASPTPAPSTQQAKPQSAASAFPTPETIGGALREATPEELRTLDELRRNIVIQSKEAVRFGREFLKEMGVHDDAFNRRDFERVEAAINRQGRALDSKVAHQQEAIRLVKQLKEHFPVFS